MAGETPEKVVAASLVRTAGQDNNRDYDAKAAMQALEAAGFRVFRPDDCETVTVENGGSYPDDQTGEEREAEPILRSEQIQTTRCLLDYGTYRLVPVGGDS